MLGWAPNPLMLFRNDNPTLDDPNWVDMGNPTGDATSFNSQPTYVVPVSTEEHGDYFLYMSDNWIHAGPNGLIDAGYVWLPFWFNDDGSVSLHNQTSWDFRNPFAQA